MIRVFVLPHGLVNFLLHVSSFFEFINHEQTLGVDLGTRRVFEGGFKEAPGYSRGSFQFATQEPRLSVGTLADPMAWQITLDASVCGGWELARIVGSSAQFEPILLVVHLGGV